MKNSSSQKGKTKSNARTAHFRDNVTDKSTTTDRNSPNSTSKQTPSPNNTNNNQHPKNKKQKTNTTSKKGTYRDTAMLNVESNTTLYATAPARTTVHIKNSRKASLARSKGKNSRKGSAQEVNFDHKTRFDVNFTLSATTINGRNDELQKGMDGILKIFREADNNAKLLPWKSSNQAFHPAIESTADTTASFADIYHSRTWLGNLDKNHRVYFQIHVGHNNK